MEFDDFKKYMEPYFVELKSVSVKLDAVKEQTTITNGRVKSLEVFRKGIWWLVGAFVTACFGTCAVLAANFVINHWKN